MERRRNVYKRDWVGFLKAVFGHPTAIAIMLFVLFAGALTALEYTHDDTVTATVTSVYTQQQVNGVDGNISTSYTYLVGTDRGTMTIEPSGIMSSQVFGTLKEGKAYVIHTRGYSFPLLGLYPYIIDAKEIDNN